MIYFDNASTTKINTDVLKTYYFLLEEYYANPSNAHFEGAKVQNLLTEARAEILNLLRVHHAKLIFTSGATEANNLFVIGAFNSYRHRGNKIIISKGEHASIRHACYFLVDHFGAELVEIPLNEDGTVNLAIFEQELTKDTIFASIIAVNNEIGAVNDLAKIRELVDKMPHTLLHSDVTQAIGKVNINYDALDAFSFSGHKLHGVKGVGALVAKDHVNLKAITFGGGQDYGLRSGTMNAPADITLSKTVRLALTNIEVKKAHIRALATKLYDYLNSEKDNLIVNSSLLNPYIVNFSLKNHKAAIIKNALSKAGIMVSTTSACSDKKEVMSPAIFAMTNDIDRALNPLRVSFSESNTLEEVDVLITTLQILLKEVRHGK